MPIKFSFSTCLAITSFIENELNPFIEKNKISSYDGHLFIDPNNFTPLSSANISKIFSEITTELGWSKGKSIYSFRHKFAGDSMDKNISAAKELKLSIDEASVVMLLQDQMTHNSPESQKSYLESRWRMNKDTEANKRELKIKELESDKIRLALEAQKAFEIAEELQKQNEEMAIELAQLRKN